MIQQMIAGLSPNQVFWLTGGAIFATYLTISGVVGSIMREWRKVRVAAIESDLKREMLAKGFPIEEIERVASTTRKKRNHPPASSGSPGPAEVIVARDGEWHPGIVLQVKGDSYLVHEIGYPLSDSRWLGPDQVRFSASAVGYPKPGSDGPPVLEAVALNPWEDEWGVALVLRESENRYYLHFVDDEESEYDGWYEESAIRFPIHPTSPVRPVFSEASSNGNGPMKPAFTEPEL